MRALVVDLSLGRAASTAVLGRLRHDAAWGRGGVLRREEIAEPALPGDGWVRVRPVLSGICGSDLKLLHVTGFSPVLTAYSPSRRIVPGHEVTGVVTATRGRTRVAEGDRVLVEPTLRCVHKGLADCARCRAGEGHLCENLGAAGDLCAGQGIGFAERVGGGWSDAFVAHDSMLYDAAGISDERAVLAEPAAVALHAALRWRGTGERVAVIGPGSIGLLVVTALRRLRPDLDISVIGPDVATFDTTRAVAAGADRVWHSAPARVLEAAAHHAGTLMRTPRFGGLPVLDGGLDAVFDCVASAQTLALAMRLLRARGELIMVGTAATQRVDWSLVWWRELSIHGAVVYGEEADGVRTFDTVREWMSDPAFTIESLVTHRYAMDDYAEALATATLGPRAGAVKVVLDNRA